MKKSTQQTLETYVKLFRSQAGAMVQAANLLCEVKTSDSALKGRIASTVANIEKAATLVVEATWMIE